MFLLFAFASMATAQEPTQGPDFKELMKQMQSSPVMRTLQKNAGKNVLKSMWNGKGGNLTFQAYLADPEMKKALDITDEQSAKLSMGGMIDFQNDPVFLEYSKEMEAIADPNDPFMAKASKENQDKFIEMNEKFTSHMFDTLSNAIDETLTDEQKQKMREVQIASMSDSPIIFPDMFEALGLSDKQREELDKIKKEMEPDFDKIADEIMDASMDIMAGLLENIDDDFDMSKPENMTKSFQDAQKKYYEKNPEAKKRVDKIEEKGKEFTNKVKFRMFDVLTDAQMEKLGNLINDPPAYAKLIRDKLRDMQGKGIGTSGYQPGLDSWKPGEPIPEGYKKHREERKSAFPEE